MCGNNIAEGEIKKCSEDIYNVISNQNVSSVEPVSSAESVENDSEILKNLNSCRNNVAEGEITKCARDGPCNYCLNELENKVENEFEKPYRFHMAYCCSGIFTGGTWYSNSDDCSVWQHHALSRHVKENYSQGQIRKYQGKMYSRCLRTPIDRVAKLKIKNSRIS